MAVRWRPTLDLPEFLVADELSLAAVHFVHLAHLLHHRKLHLFPSSTCIERECVNDTFGHSGPERPEGTCITESLACGEKGTRPEQATFRCSNDECWVSE